jgi:hypothetical protein
MGIFDRAKGWLGIGSAEDDDEAPSSRFAEDSRRAVAVAHPGFSIKDGSRIEVRRKDGRERPPLKDQDPPSNVTIDDALKAREDGDHAGARQILREIDKGGGLRTVLRAAAALEAGDEEELAPLLPIVAREEPAWRLLLQVAAALGEPAAARPYLDRAAQYDAPPWAIAWSRALSTDDTTRREGLVELLFNDAPLARTVAARDLHVDKVVSDSGAAQRYASFAHGRDSIRRFGASVVARLIDRAEGIR